MEDNMKFVVYDDFYPIEIHYDKDILYKINILKETKEKGGEKCVFSELINNQLNEYFSGKRKIFDIPHILKGTDFQLKVWNAINNIPYGKTKSYKEIAEYINYPKAYRAVGLACNKNPIPFIVPCHRVVGKNGKLTGYGGGIVLKDKLLRMEKINE